MQRKIKIISVIKSSGKKEKFNLNKIEKSILLAGKDTKTYKQGTVAKILDKVIFSLSKVKLKEISTSEIRKIVEPAIAKSGYFETAKYYILFKERKEQNKRFKFVCWEPKMPKNSKLTLVTHCSKENGKGKFLETPGEIFWRVAKHIAKAEINWGSENDVQRAAEEFFERMVNLKFICTRSALYEAGNDSCSGQLSPCFVLKIEDSISSIFRTLGEAALVQKNFGGTGFNFSSIRFKGDKVRSVANTASGPVDFLQAYSAALSKIIQGAKRHGGNMGILNVSHPDIFEFIKIKDEDGNMKNFNLSVGATNEFMEAVMANKKFNLVNPRDGAVVKKVKARWLFDRICEHAWKTGDPGMIFLDRMEEDNYTPSLGKLEATNPCVTGDTLVTTDKGILPIEKLVNKNNVNLLIDSRLSEDKYKKVSQVIKTGYRKVYKLVTKEGYELNLTPDHKLKTKEGWKEAGKFKIGEKLFIVKRKGGFGQDGNLETGRVLGWLTGDGNMKITEAVLSFFGREKQELMPMFVQLVNEITEGTQKLARNYTANGSYISQRDEAGIKSIRLWKLASEYGITPENKLMVLNLVFTGTEEMQRGFLQALFTIDGHVSGNNQKGLNVRLTSVDLKLLINVQRILLNFGIASKIYKNRRKRALRGLSSGRGGYKKYWCREYHDLAITKDNLWTFAREIGFLVDYKNLKLIDSLKDYIEGTCVETFEATFKSLIPLGTDYVFDLTEPITHSFVANGFITHNCGEQPLLPYESCNLSSIHLSNHLIRGSNGYEIDWDDLEKTVRMGVRFLDNMIEINYYVLSETEKLVKYGNRKIGLGVIGFGHVLFKLGIPYNSKEAIQLADKIAKFIKRKAEEASMELAKVRGVFPNWDMSSYKGTAEKYRNCTLITIAPTGTVSMIGDTTSGIEPCFALVYQRNSFYNRDSKNNSTKILYYIDPVFELFLKERGIYSDELIKKISKNGGVLEGLSEIPPDIKKVFITTHQISPEWHIRIQAAFQKYVDNAVSKTINFSSSASFEDVKEAYLLAWKLGCKGITIYRDGSKKDQVLKTNKLKIEEDRFEDCPECGGRLEFEGGCVTCKDCGWSKCKL